MSVRARPSVRTHAADVDGHGPVSQPEPSALRGPITVTFGARTDVGRVRPHNEDHFLVDRQLRLYVVCDGMGGHQSGEVASATAVTAVHEALMARRDVIDSYASADGQHDLNDVMAVVEDAVHQANLRVYEQGQAAALHRGMGTTLSLLLLARDTGFVAHVGDTRVYRRRAGRLSQLTEDHSLVHEMARTLNVAAERFDDRLKNAITRAVGVHAVVEVDAQAFELQPGDRYLLCSDGLHGLVDDQELSRVLDQEDSAACVDELVDRANAAGGSDNVTAIVVQIEGAATPIDAEERASLVESLRLAPLFRGLNALELRRVIEGAVRVTLEPGEVLVAQGRVQEALYVVTSGALDIVRNGITLTRLVAGHHFGEEALLHDAASVCTVRAGHEGPTQTLCLRALAFEELRKTAPTVALKLAVAVAASLARRIGGVVGQLGDLRPLYLEPIGATRPSPRPRTTARFQTDTLTSPTRPSLQPRPRSPIGRPAQPGTEPAPDAPAAEPPTPPEVPPPSAASRRDDAG